MRNENTLHVEGNNGGDYIEITPLDDGRIILKSGSCCVNTIDQIVPVEFLTSLISNVLMNFGSPEGYLMSTNWPGDFIRSLVEKCEPVPQPKFEVGYFARPGYQRSKVHITHNEVPICKTKPKGTFQWNARRVHLPYVECKNCLKRWCSL